MLTIGDTDEVVSCDQIVGSSVFDDSGRKIGEILNVLVDRAEGRIHHVVSGKSGPLGWGRPRRPIAWSALRYDARRGGYVLRREASENV